MKIKTYQSRYSGKLEIVEIKGKKYLDSETANYSYGPLQKVLKYGLKKIHLQEVKSILLLGLGGGSVVETLRNDFNFKEKITAVDIDPVVIQIAHDEFGVIADDKLEIHCEDAVVFLENYEQQFDLIIIDLFINLEIPEIFYQSSFWMNIDNCLAENSVFLFNTIPGKENEEKLFSIEQFFLLMNYTIAKYEKVNRTNTLLVATKSGDF